MKKKVIYILIILSFVTSCKRKKNEQIPLLDDNITNNDKISLHLNTIVLFDDFGTLTKNPNGIYFEILIKNNSPNIQCISTVDFEKQNIGHYISKLYVKTNKRKFKLIDLKPKWEIKKCSKLVDSLYLRLMIMENEDEGLIGLDLENMNNFITENLVNSQIIYKINNKTYSTNIETNKKHFYYNGKEVSENDILKYKMKIYKPSQSEIQKMLLKQNKRRSK